MVSPMREKRTWPPQDKDSDGETVAAFEAAVAVVKETVVRSGEVLVSAKEDLSDHQRWLKAQTARVAADRQRHDRFLQRQRERQEALERREQTRARRRAKRQALAQSISHAASASIFAVRSAVWSVASTIMAGLNAMDEAAARGLRWLGARIRNLTLVVTGALGKGAGFAGRTARAFALSVSALVAALGTRLAAKTHELAPSVVNVLSLCFGGLAARAHDISRSIGGGLGVGLSGTLRQDWCADAHGWRNAPARRRFDCSKGA